MTKPLKLKVTERQTRIAMPKTAKTAKMLLLPPNQRPMVKPHPVHLLLRKSKSKSKTPRRRKKSPQLLQMTQKILMTMHPMQTMTTRLMTILMQWMMMKMSCHPVKTTTSSTWKRT